MPKRQDSEPVAPVEESRIVIRPNGEVVIENLSEALAEVAIELDPEGDLACRLDLPEPDQADD
jgi:hypothetical protein